MLYSAVALLAVFAVLWTLRRSDRRPGWLLGWYLLLAGTERFLVEFLRAKDDRLLWGLSIAQAIAVAAAVAGASLLLSRRGSAPAPSVRLPGAPPASATRRRLIAGATR